MSDEAKVQVSGKAIARLASQRKQFKLGLDQAKTELETMRSQLQSLTAERDKHRTAAEASSQTAQAKELERLKGELRTRDHKARFKALATKAGVDADLADDLYSLSGYKPEADEVDDTKLGEVLDGLKQSKPKFFGAATPGKTEGQAATEPPPKRPGPASGQGDRNGQGADPVSRAQLNDPIFVMKNYDRVVAATKAGTIRD